MTKLNHIQAAMLAKIAEATLDQTQGFAMVKNGATSAMLAEAGLIELNPQMIEGDKIAARTTDAGVDTYQNGDSVEPVNEDNQPANEPATNQGTKPMTEFSIDTGVPVPAIKRSGAATSIYPFDALEVGQSFFVPATEDMPNPGKSLASTVSSASKRYATETGTRELTRKNRTTGEQETVTVPTYTYERKFMVRSVEENGVKGARVWRIEPKNDAADGDDE
jgi:hypothetical protein